MGVVGSILYVGPLHLYFCCKLKYVKLEKVPLLILKLNWEAANPGLNLGARRSCLYSPLLRQPGGVFSWSEFLFSFFNSWTVFSLWDIHSVPFTGLFSTTESLNWREICKSCIILGFVFFSFSIYSGGNQASNGIIARTQLPVLEAQTCRRLPIGRVQISSNQS